MAAKKAKAGRSMSASVGFTPLIRQPIPGTFERGARVRISKGRVVDEKREHEQIPEDQRIPIDEDVSGLEGNVIGPPYESKGKLHVPVEVGTGGLLGVPEDRLEPVRSAGTMSGERIVMGFNRRYEAGYDRAFAKKRSKSRRH